MMKESIQRMEKTKAHAALFALDLADLSAVGIDVSLTRVGLVCGKRGSGKTVTLSALADVLSESFDVLFIDPMGIASVYCEGPYKKLVLGEDLKIPLHLTGETLLRAFDLTLSSPQGIVLFRALNTLGGGFFTMDDLIEQVEMDEHAKDSTKQALINRLLAARGWGVFAEELTDLSEIFEGFVIVDVSRAHLQLRQVVVLTIADVLLQSRLREKKERGIYFILDEAQEFAPRREGDKNEIVRLAKEGRLPGISMILATQQPSAVSTAYLSQVDFVVSHRLTLNEDIKALKRLTPSFIKGDLKIYMRKVRNPGEAIFIDDVVEDFRIIRVVKGVIV